LLTVLGSLPVFLPFEFGVVISDFESSLLGLFSDEGLESELLLLAGSSILWRCFGLGWRLHW
jgi:hypothetical protein